MDQLGRRIEVTPLRACIAVMAVAVVVALGAFRSVDAPSPSAPSMRAWDFIAFADTATQREIERREAVILARAERRVNPFDQLRLVGLDGAELQTVAEELDIDLGAIASLDLSEINLSAIDPSDRRCLTQAIYYEARNQTVSGQMAVADVVLNRVASRRYPNTVCGVVFEGSTLPTGCQFSFTCDGSLRARIERDAMYRSQVLATAVLGGFRLELSKNATNYHADYVRPYWAPTLDETVRIGDHIFYRRGRNFSDYAAAH